MPARTKTYRHAETVDSFASLGSAGSRSSYLLTILSHPDPGRVGQISRLDALPEGELSVSRLEPLFAASTGGATEPLADSRLSRRPLQITGARSGLRLDPTATTTRVELDGECLSAPRDVPDDALDAGVVVALGRTITLLLHKVPPAARRAPRYGLIGESAALERVRSAVERVADLEVPVLLRGESGAGKELVARALHDASRRKSGPFVAVNMAAISPSTAASELFGHVRGAFTGAVRDHDGFFSRAHGGTLFLDEIGDTPTELQPMLLRVLETGELQRVGGTRRERVDVRVVAATDQDLDAMLGAGFRAPLFHRLSGYAIALPPLRSRRDDIARLFVAFAAAELTTTGDAAQLAPRTESEPPYVSTELATRLVLHGWPGNVRELRNVTRQIVIASRGCDVLAMPELTRPRTITPAPLPVVMVPGPDPLAAPVRPPPPAFKPSQMDDDALVAALEAHAWKPGPTAEALGISRTTLYAMIEKSPRIRKARDVPEAELLAELAQAAGDLDLVAETLHVSKRGLQLRLKEIGVTSRGA